jgi:hypothetical protein
LNRGRIRLGIGALLGVLFAAAVGLRLFAVLAYWPAGLGKRDSAAYVRAAHNGLGLDTLDPSGYPLFLRLAHTISSQLVFTVALQHVLGLASGLLVYLAVRRLGGPRWLGLIPAAVVWFNGDQIFLEHTLLTESLFTFLLSALVYAAVRCLDEAPRTLWLWPAVTGALAGGLLAVRSVSLLLAPLVIAWLVLALWRTGRPWVQGALAAGGAALVIVAGYSVLRHDVTGRWAPVADGSGWILYSRVAQFADCTKFDPPRGTRVLCETSPPDSRPGQLYYEWLGGPARRAFGDPPRHDATVGSFARAAILHQPFAYLHTVGDDLRRYFDPSASVTRLGGGADADAFTFLREAPRYDSEVLREAHAYYQPFTPRTGDGAGLLSDYQRAIRVHGPLLMLFLVLAFIGVWAAAGRVRWALVLLAGLALYLLVFPVATTLYEWRFGIPGLGASAAAAALGGWSLAERVRARRSSVVPARAQVSS